ncbi:MAG: NUDIX domain-containing protein [Planctomyces sp.]|nr:NUDIX domain-containing protein [Planctomyces sp.]
MKKKAADRPIEKVWGFCPRCGAKASKRGVNPFHCRECEYTHYFGPCAAVGAITTDPEGKVLLLIRGKDPGKGMYGLPGGFVDQGETVEDALRREVMEEIGLTVTDYRYLASFPNQYAYSGAVLPVMDVFFVMTVRSFDEIAVVDGEIDAWHFCHPTRRELQNMAFESNRRALELFLKQRSVRSRERGSK